LVVRSEIIEEQQRFRCNLDCAHGRGWWFKFACPRRPCRGWRKSHFFQEGFLRATPGSHITFGYSVFGYIENLANEPVEPHINGPTAGPLSSTLGSVTGGAPGQRLLRPGRFANRDGTLIVDFGNAQENVPANGWIVGGRNIWIGPHQGQQAIHFDAQPRSGLAWRDGLTFSEGVIEADIADFAGHMGIAFWVQDSQHYSAVYFRPQNRPEDSSSGARGVQYVAMPEYGWERLRRERGDAYENSAELPNLSQAHGSMCGSKSATTRYGPSLTIRSNHLWSLMMFLRPTPQDRVPFLW
jgi:hypothetical protein